MPEESMQSAKESELPAAESPLNVRLGFLRMIFWFTYIGVFVPSLFIPALPVLDGEDIFWIVPVWGVYVFLFLSPLLAFPIVMTHVSVCFYLARFVSNRWNPETNASFSLRSILIVIAFVSIVLGVIMKYHIFGFLALFCVLSTSITAVSITDWNFGEVVEGLRIPKKLAALLLFVFSTYAFVLLFGRLLV